MKRLLFLFCFLFQITVFARPGEIIPGQFIVTLDPDASPEDVVREHQVQAKFIYHAALKGFAGKMSEAAQAGLLSDPRVWKIEQDRVITADSTETGATWGLDRIDQRALPLTGTYDYNYTGSGVTAYIIDTGIRYDHSEFGGRATFGYDAFGGNGSDCNGHGTHVAGTVGGTVYGVAKQVSLVAVRVLDCNGSGSTSSVLAGLDWVRQNRRLPAVANLSLGGSISSTLDSGLLNMINSGVATAVAAGNSNADACNSSPARVPEAMTVAASDSSDVKASFSNFGNCVDWFAPGVSITSASYSSTTGTVVYSGTSMASPHVAGAAALYLQHFPSASPATVRDALYNATTKSIVTSAATANNHLLYSLEAASTPPPASTDTTAPTVSITSPANGSTVNRRTTIAITNAASDNVGVTSVEVRVNGSLQCTLTAAPYTCNWRVPNQAARTYQIQSKAFDAAGNSASSAVVTVTSQ